MINGDTIKEIMYRARETLKNFGDETYDIDAKVLLKHTLSCDDMYLVIHSNDILNSDKKQEYFSYIERRKVGEPVAYITGKKEFMGFNFKVTKDVLIPRPDTETLVNEVLRCSNDRRSLRILDLCTGSGAIGITLAKMLSFCEVTMVDVSMDALEVARENAIDLMVDHRCEFMCLDVLSDLSYIDEQYDIVVSNPPYIRSDVLHTLMNDVKDYEPSLALDGGEDGLVFYRRIISEAEQILKKDGLIFFEIGYDQAEDVADMMKNKFRDIYVMKDLGLNPRVVRGSRI
ncbi:MAG: peptide chain release factor N(5)-glutamine methyltransferase [Ruminococcaceae bacterium]|nr:peptide chain release factor N(5)-glutamine methyltransferase [Oscillospiraceae bacterium]